MLETTLLTRYARNCVLAALLAGWSGCDHGPLPPVADTPTPTTSANPVATASPSTSPTPIVTATPADLGLSGAVLDHDTRRPLAKAVIVLSHEMYATDKPPENVVDGAVAVTTNDGSFHLAPVAAGTYPLEVYAPGHVAMHEELTVTDTNARLAPFIVSRLTPEEQNWLNQLNRDRASWAAPPLVADEAVLEAARMRAATMADNGVFSHTCLPHQKNCLSGPEAELAKGAYQAGGENIGAQNEGTWRDVESGMLSEWIHCSPAARKPHSDGCSFSEETGHFLNMVNRSYHFVGVAAYHHGRSFDASYGPSTDYYAMEFE